MAFDIHGNDLRKGYCEVHPYVNQEYPCNLCYNEIENRNRRNGQDLEKRAYEKRLEDDYYNSINPDLDVESVRIVIDMLIVRIPKSELSAEIIDVNFDGHYMIQITKDIANDVWSVTNDMNGYGNNCFEQFKNSKVSILS